ncbi:integrase DNA-binding domain-containing protein [Lachnospiraceae bacterium ZAX-1]
MHNGESQRKDGRYAYKSLQDEMVPDFNRSTRGNLICKKNLQIQLLFKE